MKTALVWLRNDLRFEDQNSFFTACQEHERVVAYFSFEPKDYDKTMWGFTKTGKFRTHFLLETLRSLHVPFATSTETITLGDFHQHVDFRLNIGMT